MYVFLLVAKRDAKKFLASQHWQEFSLAFQAAVESSSSFSDSSPKKGEETSIQIIQVRADKMDLHAVTELRAEIRAALYSLKTDRIVCCCISRDWSTQDLVAWHTELTELVVFQNAAFSSVFVELRDVAGLRKQIERASAAAALTSAAATSATATSATATSAAATSATATSTNTNTNAAIEIATKPKQEEYRIARSQCCDCAPLQTNAPIRANLLSCSIPFCALHPSAWFSAFFAMIFQHQHHVNAPLALPCALNPTCPTQKQNHKHANNNGVEDATTTTTTFSTLLTEEFQFSHWEDGTSTVCLSPTILKKEDETLETDPSLWYQKHRPPPLSLVEIETRPSMREEWRFQQRHNPSHAAVADYVRQQQSYNSSSSVFSVYERQQVSNPPHRSIASESRPPTGALRPLASRATSPKFGCCDCCLPFIKCFMFLCGRIE